MRTACQYGHEYDLSVEDLITIRVNAKKSPCLVGQLRSDSAVKNLTLFFITLFKDALGGKRCPPQCIFGHTCPFGGACKFRRTCRFKHLHLVWLLSVVIPLVVPCPNSFFCRRPLTLYRLPRRSIARRQNCMRDTGFTRRAVFVKSSNVYSYVQRRNFLHVFHQRLSYSLADIQRDASFSAIMDTSFSETSSDASFTHASPTLSLLYIGRILPLVFAAPYTFAADMRQDNNSSTMDGNDLKRAT